MSVKLKASAETLDELVQNINNVVNHIVRKVCKESRTGNLSISFEDDLNELISWDDYLTYLGFIIHEIETREEVLDVYHDGSSDEFDVNVGLNYLDEYDDPNVSTDYSVIIKMKYKDVKMSIIRTSVG